MINERFPAERGDNILRVEAACCVVVWVGDETAEGVEGVEDDAAHEVGDVLAGEGVGKDEEPFVFHDGSVKYWFDG